MAKKEEQQTANGVSAKSALIFEMDNIALGARRIRYEVLAGILKEEKIGLSPVQFSRYCLHPAPSVYMESFLETMKYKSATPEQVVDRLTNETVSHLMQKSTTINPGLIKWIEAAQARGAAVACISMLPQAAAEGVAAHLHFERWGIKVFSATPTDKGFPHAKNWLQMAKAIARHPRRCLAIVSSMTVAKTALAAMMNIVVVPDEFTEYQDFCGANLVCTDLKEVKPDEFFEQISF